MPIDVSVLVPVLDEAATIDATVAGMLAQRGAGTIELLFADDGSTDGTRAMLEAHAARDPRVRVFANVRGGTASGLNVCLRHARGTYVARMDAHTLFGPDHLALGVARLRRGDVDWVCGPQLPVASGPVSQAVVDALATPLGRGGSAKWTGEAEAEFALDTGVFCGVWRRADVLASGGWDEGWPRNQDAEMAARFLRAGRPIVCVPAMAARYTPRSSLRAVWRQFGGYGYYRVRTAGRHPTSLRRSALLPPLVVLDLAACVLAPRRALRRPALLGAAAYAAALGVAGVATARRHGPARGARVPLALAAMHLGNGTRFLAGLRRWGVPWRALATAVGLPPRPVDAGPYGGPVHAPSLHEG